MHRYTKGGYETLLLIIIALVSTLIVSGLPWKSLPQLTAPGEIVQQKIIPPGASTQYGIQAKTLDIQTTWAPQGMSGIAGKVKTLVDVIQSTCGGFVRGGSSCIAGNPSPLFPLIPDGILHPEIYPMIHDIATGILCDNQKKLPGETCLQCVGFAAAVSYYLTPQHKFLPVGFGNAYAYAKPHYPANASIIEASNFQWVTPAQKAQTGDFAIWGEPGANHIAYVLDAHSTYFTVAEANGGDGSVDIVQTERYDDPGLSGFWRPI